MVNSKISSKGQLTIPKKLREEYDLKPGDKVSFEQTDAGLNHPSLVRLKLFTSDQRLILRALGHLSTRDQDNLTQSLSTHLPIR